MKRLLSFFSLLVICAVNLHAQGDLSLTMKPKVRYTHSNDPEISALMVEVQGIKANLQISSTSLVVEKVDTFSDGGKKQYWYEIRVRKGTKWKQNIDFYLDGYTQQTREVAFDAGKELQPIIITDPNNATTGYYYHRKIAREYFEKGDYDRAMAELNTAATQSNVKKEELEVLIAEIDTIQGLYAAAQDSTSLKNYYAAGRIYERILELNENDKNASKKIKEMEDKYKDYTNNLYKEAENLRSERKLTEATEYYQKYLDFHGNDFGAATDRLNAIKRQIQNKREMPHVFYYQFDGRAPINFGYGHFKDRGAGWFMNFSMNKEIFNLLSGEWKPTNKKGKEVETHSNVADTVKLRYLAEIDNVPEINLALVGLSIPLVSPHPEKENQYFRVGKLVVPKFPALYLNIVPLSASLAFGYDETSWYEKTTEGKKPTTEDKAGAIKDYKTKALVSYAPQVGLTLKWGRLALFYTYEYRYLVNDRTMYKDAIRNGRSMFGLGFAW